MHASVRWQEGLQFEGHSEGRVTVPMQGGSINPADREGFSSLQLMLIGLVGCTGMDVISILEKKRQRVTDFEVRVDATQADSHPRVFTGFSLEYSVTGHEIDPQAVERAIELSVEKYCPSVAMLGQVAPIEHRFEIHPAD